MTDKIKIETPRPNSLIQSPLEIEGEARGSWFFEASFPVKLFDGNNRQIAESYVQAQGEWMTPELVPFKGVLQFNPPKTKTGFLTFEKDNPSGLPEQEESFRIPVRFR